MQNVIQTQDSFLLFVHKFEIRKRKAGICCSLLLKSANQLNLNQLVFNDPFYPLWWHLVNKAASAHAGFDLPAHSERVMDWICSVFWVFSRRWRVLKVPAHRQRGHLTQNLKHRGDIRKGQRHQSYRSFRSACRAPLDPKLCVHSALPLHPCSASCRQRRIITPALHLLASRATHQLHRADMASDSWRYGHPNGC